MKYIQLTSSKNRRLWNIHDRMPVIHKREDEALWLDREVQEGNCWNLYYCRNDERQMKVYSVSKMVGNVRYDIYQDLTL
ncbi:SOS response-associated peptidase [Brevibacillus halotolerans]|uniref:SOS response-associated peptidase n=2 Tax=Brevibacillus TaxID=55080 RepID=UPI00215C3C2A|nr:MULTISPECIES: SOS response-associated peptidase [Brevibacillus]MCR8965960.1 SOS response-associated peptidase [Brevibacillus laterosporus]MCZ0838116.1 SOS response-associated peptidase [Brevibacillus halotolerans]